MEALYSRLHHLLCQQIDCHESLIESLKNERELLKRLAPEELQDNTGAKQALLDRIRELEELRMAISGEIADFLGISPEDATLSRTAESAPDPWSRKLFEARERLLHLTRSVIQLNERNRRLFTQGRNHFKRFMSLLGAAGNPNRTYHRSGQMSPSGKGQGMLLSRSA